jgi:hypothetical protein
MIYSDDSYKILGDYSIWICETNDSNCIWIRNKENWEYPVLNTCTPCKVIWYYLEVDLVFCKYVLQT